MTLQYLVVFAIRYVLAFDSFLVKGNNEVGNEYFLLRKGRKRKWQRYEALALLLATKYGDYKSGNTDWIFLGCISMLLVVMSLNKRLISGSSTDANDLASVYIYELLKLINRGRNMKVNCDSQSMVHLYL